MGLAFLLPGSPTAVRSSAVDRLGASERPLYPARRDAPTPRCATRPLLYLVLFFERPTAFAIMEVQPHSGGEQRATRLYLGNIPASAGSSRAAAHPGMQAREAAYLE